MSVGLTFPRAVRSEWIKLRTLRSTWITYAVALLVTDGLAVLVCSLHGREVHREGLPLLPDAAAFPLRPIMFAQLAIGVLGVLFVTGEYATGMIRASITAAPRRTPVALAKALVFGVCTTVVAGGLCFVAFFAGQAILSQWHYDVSITAPGALRSVLGATFYLVCIGLIGLGLGWAIRNTGGAIATLFGIVLVLPLLVQALPHSWQDNITKFLPLSIVERIVSTEPADPGSHPLAMWLNFAVLAGYVVLALGAGWLVLKRRDV